MHAADPQLAVKVLLRDRIAQFVDGLIMESVLLGRRQAIPESDLVFTKLESGLDVLSHDSHAVILSS